jgi:signal peptidase II
MTPKARWFWPLALALLVADCASKRAVESHLPVGEPQPVVGEVIRLTLSYNADAAMGLKLAGEGGSRYLLAGLSLAALCVLGVLYRHTGHGDRRRAIGVALVVGGAIGNLLDRLRSGAGVVDFIDLGIADVRFWTFNIADVGITAGALLLLFTLGRFGRKQASFGGSA